MFKVNIVLKTLLDMDSIYGLKYSKISSESVVGYLLLNNSPNYW